MRDSTVEAVLVAVRDHQDALKEELGVFAGSRERRHMGRVRSVRKKLSAVERLIPQLTDLSEKPRASWTVRERLWIFFLRRRYFVGASAP